MNQKRHRCNNNKQAEKVVIDIEDDTISVENRLFHLERSMTKMEICMLNMDAKLDVLCKLSINMSDTLKNFTSMQFSKINDTFQGDGNDEKDSPEVHKANKINSEASIEEELKQRVSEIFNGSLRNLGVEQYHVLNYIFNDKENPNEIIVDMLGEVGERKELQRFQPSKWLSAEILNLYACMLRRENQYGNDETALEKWYMPTYVSQCIINKLDAGSIYRKFLRKDKFGGNIQKCEKIFIPMNLENHWYLCIVDIIKEEVQIMDSLRHVNCTNRSSTVKYVIKCFHEALEIGLGIFYTKNISTFRVEMAHWAPQQNNGSDCGVFTIRFMQLYEKIRDGMRFRIENSSSERLSMALEIFYHDANQSKEDILRKIKNS